MADIIPDGPAIDSATEVLCRLNEVCQLTGETVAEREQQAIFCRTEIARAITKARGIGGTRWRHCQRGTEYTVLVSTAEAQCSTGPINEGDHVTVYVDDEGSWWVRKTAEFQDGRFERKAAGDDR